MIHCGDCLEVMKGFNDNSIDFIVTDPPYGLSFMAKSWDKETPALAIWQEAFRICKPGAMLAAFGGTRTFHRLTCAIEDAGWEIRDCIMFLHGQGFPKSHNKFGLDGYGTALKPAHEPIIICQKPLDGTYKQNVKKWGIGGINIDGCRIGSDQITTSLRDRSAWHANNFGNGGYEKPLGISEPRIGRWPANLILDEEAAQMLDEQSGILKSGSGNRRPNGGGQMFDGFAPMEANFQASTGGASRFFYCAKASSKERNAGLEGKDNKHPCVKPISLMKYIIKLLAPPNNPTLLDPFCGSGSTLIAAKELGINAIGIEKEAEYCEIAENRLKNR